MLVKLLLLVSYYNLKLHNLYYSNSSSAKTVECKVVGLEGVSYQNINNQVTYRPSARLPQRVRTRRRRRRSRKKDKKDMVGRDNEQTQLGVTQYFKLALDHYNFKGQ